MGRTEHFAQEFRGHADIGGDLLLGEAFDQRGILQTKAGIAFDGRLAQNAHQAGLVSDQRILGQDTEEAFEPGDVVIETVQIRFPKPEDLGILQGVAIESAGLLALHTPHVTGPPARRSELKDMLKAVLVERITAQETFCDKSRPLGDLALAEKELFLPEMTKLKKGGEMGLFLRSEVDLIADMLQEQ